MKFAIILFLFILVACETPLKYQARVELRNKTPEQILSDIKLREIAARRGEEIFNSETCWNCHGRDLRGKFTHCPNLIDDQWIWGAKPSDIFYTIKYGVRQLAKAPPINEPALNTRWLVMPRFEEYLEPAQIEKLAKYIIEQDKNDLTVVKLYQENCVSCHGEIDKENQTLGAMNLSTTNKKYKLAELGNLIARDVYAESKGPNSISVISRAMPA